MRLHINPETIRWNYSDKSIKCRTEDGRNVFIPRTEVTCQNKGVVQNWEANMMYERGLECITEQEEGGTIIASRAKAQIEDFQKLELWKKGEFEVTGITPWGLFTVPKHSDLVAYMHVSELSRARLGNLRFFYKRGDVIEAMVYEKDKLGYRVSLSRKDLYPTLQEVAYKYAEGDKLMVRVTKRLNADGWYCEVNPGIPGIVSGNPQKINSLYPGQAVLAKIRTVKKNKGLQLDLVEKY